MLKCQKPTYSKFSQCFLNKHNWSSNKNVLPEEERKQHWKWKYWLLHSRRCNEAARTALRTATDPMPCMAGAPYTALCTRTHRSDPPRWGRKLLAQPSQISVILIPAAHLYPSVKRQFSWGHISRAREKMWIYRSSMDFKASWSYFINIQEQFYDSMILWSFVQWGET